MGPRGELQSNEGFLKSSQRQLGSGILLGEWWGVIDVYGPSGWGGGGKMRKFEDPGFRRTDPIIKYIHTSTFPLRSDTNHITVPARGHITECLHSGDTSLVRLDSGFPIPGHQPSFL